MIYKIRARLRPGSEAALLGKLTDGRVACSSQTMSAFGTTRTFA